MKKNVSLFFLSLLTIQVIFTAQIKQKRVLTEFQRKILESKREVQLNTPPSTPRREPGKLDTPRTPRAPEQYYLPYFFDGIIQYVFLKKEETKIKPTLRVTPLILSLIPLEEQNVFISKTSNYFKIIEESGLLGGLNSVWLEKTQDISGTAFNGYEVYELDKVLEDEYLSEELKNSIKAIQKTVLCVPLFYQILNNQINILIKKDDAQIKQKMQLILSTKDEFLLKGSVANIKDGIKKIVQSMFVKEEDLEFDFSPIFISVKGSSFIFMQPIDISLFDLNDINSKEYAPYSVEKIFDSKFTLQMRKRLTNFYEKLNLGKYDKEKIDTSFVELFMKEYRQYEQVVAEKLQRSTDQKQAQQAEQERIATEQGLANEKRQEEERAAEAKRIEEFRQRSLEVPKTPDTQESNVKPTEVIQGKKAEKVRIETELQQKQLKKEKQRQGLSSESEQEQESERAQKEIIVQETPRKRSKSVTAKQQLYSENREKETPSKAGIVFPGLVKERREIQKSPANIDVSPESIQSKLQTQSQQDVDKEPTKESSSNAEPKKEIQSEAERQNSPEKPEPQSTADQLLVKTVEGPEVVFEQTVKNEPAATSSQEQQEKNLEEPVVEKLEPASTEEPVALFESTSNAWDNFWSAVGAFFTGIVKAIKNVFSSLF